MLRKIFKIFKRSVEFLYNFKNKYLDKETTALDEVVKDYMDYEMAGDTAVLPETFTFIPREIFDQRKDGYRSSCTAQGTGGASDVIRKYKADKIRTNPFDLRDEVKKRKLGKEGTGAYLIDTIKTALDLKFINGYYRVLTDEALKKAMYNTDLIVTGSNKINWKELQENGFVVQDPGIGSGHAFYLIGWNKIGYIAMNSYSEKYGLHGRFVIPYNVFWKVAFNSTYAVVVNPEWTKLSREELYKQYFKK